MNMTDRPVLPTGVLELNIFRDGLLIETWREQNLIVDGCKAVLAALLGGSVSGKSVTKIGLGSNGALPVGSNTSLTNLFAKTLSSVTYPVAGQVRFNFLIGTGDANGLNIMEFGLITADGTLVARRVRGTAIPKDSSISFTGSWTVTF